MSFQIVYAKQTAKQTKHLKAAGLAAKTQSLIGILRNNPYQNPPPYEKLVGDLQGAYSRRINHKHRLVYQVLENEQTVRILSMWTHYG